MVVLAVDEDIECLNNLKRCIKESDNSVELVTFTDSVLALKYIKEHTVDILFTEVRMSSVTGFELTKCLKEKMPNAYVVFVTRTEEHAIHAWAAHVNGYLLKPVDLQRVRAELECMQVY
ncbi:MAG: response regulator [Lachnospiraceae bacterium]|nr:response regulator [Lachnospiraceae bacterium]